MTSGPAGGRTTARIPRPGPGEVLLRVRACGVCRTDLHLAEGDLPPQAAGRSRPGHEVVGEVDRARPGAPPGSAPATGSACAWLGGTDGTCRFCRRGAENLCPAPDVHRLGRRRRLRRATAVAGGLRLPAAGRRSPTSRPRRCCAPGIIGYRALRRGRAAARRPRSGIYGFGGSRAPGRPGRAGRGAARARAHPPRQAAPAGPASSARRPPATPTDAPPEPLDAAILFAPVGEPGAGRAARAGPRRHARRRRHPPDRHPAAATTTRELFQERQLRSVTANTRADGEEFLRLAAEIPIRPTTVPYPFAAPTRPCRTWRRTGSPARPCCTWTNPDGPPSSNSPETCRGRWKFPVCQASGELAAPRPEAAAPQSLAALIPNSLWSRTRAPRSTRVGIEVRIRPAFRASNSSPTIPAMCIRGTWGNLAARRSTTGSMPGSFPHPSFLQCGAAGSRRQRIFSRQAAAGPAQARR